MIRWMIGLVVIFTLALAGCSKSVPVQNPAPFAAASSPAATEQAILDALPKHNWSAENVEPGKIVGFLSVRSHLLRVDISYDDSNVILAYRDSDHLDEERSDAGEVMAHYKVNKWMDTLANDIRLAIAAQPAPSQDATLSSGGEAASAEAAAPAVPADATPADTTAEAAPAP